MHQTQILQGKKISEQSINELNYKFSVCEHYRSMSVLPEI